VNRRQRLDRRRGQRATLAGKLCGHVPGTVPQVPRRHAGHALDDEKGHTEPARVVTPEAHRGHRDTRLAHGLQERYLPQHVGDPGLLDTGRRHAQHEPFGPAGGRIGLDVQSNRDPGMARHALDPQELGLGTDERARPPAKPLRIQDTRHNAVM
jgi:hypothetical protein